MIDPQFRINDPEIPALAQASIQNFFNEIGGVVVTQVDPAPQAGPFRLSFDSKWLPAPVVGAFYALSTSCRAAQTLWITEPGPVEIRLMYPDQNETPLAFLEISQEQPPKLTVTPLELLTLTGDQTPIIKLKTLLTHTAREVVTEGFPLFLDFRTNVGRRVSDLVQQIVARYYVQIDRGLPTDIDEVVALFAPDATYNRAGETLCGTEAISHFYRETRTLTGEHTIKSVTVTGLSAMVIGEFHGVSGQDGKRRDLSFVDTWRFSVGGEVIERTTYLDNGFATTC